MAVFCDGVIMFSSSEETEIAIVKEKIRSKLQTKLDSLPNPIKEIIEKGILSGGVSASLFHNQMPNDWDIYLSNADDVKEFDALINQNVDLIDDINPKYMAMDTLIDGKVITARATTLKNSVQVITMETKEHRKTFDFIHCMPWFDIANGKYFISKDQYRAIKSKKIIINPEAKQVAQYRIEKYLNRGWTK